MSLFKTYKDTYIKELQQELGIKNVMQVPKLTKIVVNMGLGEALADQKVIERAGVQLTQITGQKPLTTRAKRSIATFKLRAGDKIGLKVTLRGSRMYDFLEKLTRIVLPRLRDFRGISRTGFDGQGNYNLGIPEITVFPEIDYAQLDKTRGLEITLVTTAKTDKFSLALLTKLGLPFTHEGKKGENFSDKGK